MSFTLPVYRAPDFSAPAFARCPDARFVPAPCDGAAPEGYHSTSMYPEYFRIHGRWTLAEESRMDSCVVLRDSGRLDVVELRNLKQGDLVALGRTDDGAEGIYLHTGGFAAPEEQAETDAFAFRQGRSRETSYTRDYDRLIQLLRHEKEHGNILWVMGPAFSFDAGARAAMQALVEAGYAHGLLAGNALATHDLEGAHLHTALGQDILHPAEHARRPLQSSGRDQPGAPLRQHSPVHSGIQHPGRHHVQHCEAGRALCAHRLHPGRRPSAGGDR